MDWCKLDRFILIAPVYAIVVCVERTVVTQKSSFWGALGTPLCTAASTLYNIQQHVHGVRLYLIKANS